VRTDSLLANARTDPRRCAAVLIACLLALIAVSTPAPAWAKSYSMPTVRIEAAIQADGSLSVTEQRTFTFEGDFTRVYWDLEPPSGGAITDVTVAGPGGPMPPAKVEGRPAGFSRISANGNMTHVEAYGTMTDETITYALAYRVTGAAVRWADTAELYWKCIPSNWTIGTGALEIVVKPPTGVTAEQVKAWAHGPLTGTVHIQPDGSITLSVADLPASTFVEARMIFPAAALSAATPRAEQRLQTVLTEEASWADRANAERLAAQQKDAEQVAYNRQMDSVMGVCSVAFPLLLFVIALVVYLRFGRETKPSFQGEYFREPPADLHPAVVSYLMGKGAIENTAVSATLMDLADRGAVRMEPVTLEKITLFGTKQEATYLLTLVREKWDGLRFLDQTLLSFLFTKLAGDDTITIDEMQVKAKEDAQGFQTGINDFKARVAEEAASMGFAEPRGRKLRALVWVLAVFAGMGTAFAACSTENVIGGLVGGAFTFGMVIVAGLMKQLSPAATEMHAKYVGLRNYLRDFSRLQEAPPASIVLWNKFLVLAVVFGIADEVIEQLRVRMPEVVADPGLATTYWWASSGAGYASPVSALEGGVHSAASIASSELSGSSGGGGGFSGGGGGGFGGGGGGGAD
jgi:uncharacterized membrane protein